MRVKVPLALCFITGVFCFVQFFVPHEYGVKAYKITHQWARIIGAFALVLGIGSLLKNHLGRISGRRPDWPYSIVTLVALAATAFVMVWKGLNPGTPGYWVFMNVQVPLDGTMFSMLAFFIASAAYRTFRARTPEAAVLLVAAIIIMIGRVPVGQFFGDWLGGTAEWIFNVPATAAKRGILLGVALGSIATSLRIIVGLERSYLGGDERS